MKTTKTQEVAKRVLEAVRAEPHRFNMGAWILPHEEYSEQTLLKSDCGTAMCLAGWAIATDPEMSRSLYSPYLNEYFMDGEMVESAPALGAQIFDITLHEAQGLFYTSEKIALHALTLMSEGVSVGDALNQADL